MKYSEKYPKQIRLVLSPVQPYEVEPGIQSVDHAYQCDNCREYCRFVVNETETQLGVYCCSEECKVSIDTRQPIEWVEPCPLNSQFDDLRKDCVGVVVGVLGIPEDLSKIVLQ
jgi:hypothetical protein